MSPSPRPAKRGLARVTSLLLMLFLLGAGMRLASIQHGGPDNYLPDTHVVRNALGMAKDKHPIPPSGRYSTYPYLLSYSLLPIYAGQYALGRAQGDWANAEEFKSAVMTDPWRVHLPARIWLALLAAGAPLFVFLGLRRCGLGAGAIWGAVLLATCLLHVHHSGQERPWAPLITFMMACAWACSAYVQEARARWLIVAGALAGLAVATHQGGLAAALMPAIAWVLVTWDRRGQQALGAALGGGFACAGAFLVVAIALGYPFLLLHGAPSGDAVVMGEALAGTQHITLGGQSTVIGFRWATLERLSKVLVGYDPGLVLLGVTGVVGGLAGPGGAARCDLCLSVGRLLFDQRERPRSLLVALRCGARLGGRLCGRTVVETPGRSGGLAHGARTRCHPSDPVALCVGTNRYTPLASG